MQSHVCLVCKRSSSPYTCPKCLIPYCSLNCYKSHSSKCTEIFYQQHVINELKGSKVNDSERSKMYKILKDNLASENQDADIHSILSESSILAHQEDITEEILSDESRHRFRRMIANGSIFDLISINDPWWIDKTKFDDKIEDNLNTYHDLFSNLPWSQVIPHRNLVKEIPKIVKPSNIPDIQSILKGQKPSPYLSSHLVNIIYAYCYMWCIYAGDWDYEHDEIVSSFIILSEVLSTNTIGDIYISNVLNHSLSISMSNISISNSIHFSISIIRYTAIILYQWEFVIKSLSSLLKFFEETKCKTCPKQTKTKIIKKLQFFLSWTYEYATTELLNETADAVTAFWKSKCIELDANICKRKEKSGVILP